MHIYIDETGAFSGFRPTSVSAVGALAIPSGKLDAIAERFAKIRGRLPVHNGEVKGRLLDERQVNDVVALLADEDALFEITVVDLGLHDEAVVNLFKEEHSRGMLARVPSFAQSHQQEVEAASRQIQTMPAPLYLQSIATFELLRRVIAHVTLYFVQRDPVELGTFAWIFDGKDPSRSTNWESWLQWYSRGAIASMTAMRPSPMLEGAEYSHFRRFGAIGDDGAEGTDLGLLFENLRFAASADVGLELIDILVNATRRALVGNLQEHGWRNIRKLMVHRKEQYIQCIVLGGKSETLRGVSYARVVRHFSSDGRPMLTGETLQRYAAEK